MDWVIVLIVIGVFVIFLMFGRQGQVNQAAAVEYLRQGAKVIDVRNRAEFQSGHLSNAINIPLGELEPLVGGQVPNKDQVLLLHCVSGVRSAMAAKRLKRLGYTQAYNLGSYRRAGAIVRESSR